MNNEVRMVRIKRIKDVPPTTKVRANGVRQHFPADQDEFEVPENEAAVICSVGAFEAVEYTGNVGMSDAPLNPEG
jgi:hypothetical protein